MTVYSRGSIWVICPKCKKGRWVRTRNMKKPNYTGLCVHCADHHRLWKGGQKIAHGRMMIFAPNHPYSDKAGYIFRSHIVVEKVTGELVKPGQHVHHINRDILDDSPSNLVVLSPAEHSRVHKELGDMDRIRGKDGKFTGCQKV